MPIRLIRDKFARRIDPVGRLLAGINESIMTGNSICPAVLGVYSLRKISAIGSGETMVDHKNVTYWYVRQMSEERFEVQPLSTQGLPSGIVKMVALREFIKTYTPEPFYYSEHPVAALENLAYKLLDGGEDVSPGALDGREYSALKAFMVGPFATPDSSSPEYEKEHRVLLESVRKVLGALLSRCVIAKYEHRVRFNRFGVSLRKDGYFDESIGFFAKALEIETRDENLYFNMARVYYDMGDYHECSKALGHALSINPDFVEASKFLRYIATKERSLS